MVDWGSVWGGSPSWQSHPHRVRPVVKTTGLVSRAPSCLDRPVEVFGSFLCRAPSTSSEGVWTLQTNPKPTPNTFSDLNTHVLTVCKHKQKAPRRLPREDGRWVLSPATHAARSASTAPRSFDKDAKQHRERVKPSPPDRKHTRLVQSRPVDQKPVFNPTVSGTFLAVPTAHPQELVGSPQVRFNSTKGSIVQTHLPKNLGRL